MPTFTTIQAPQISSNCHEILGNRFLFREGRGPAWHRLGTSFPDDTLDLVEAVHRAGADYKITKFDSYIFTKEGRKKVEDYQFVVRQPLPEDPEYRVLGSVSKDYHVHDNVQLAQQINHLTTKWRVETVGVLSHGATFFAVLDAGEFEIKGDPGRQYFTLIDDKSGSRALRSVFTPVVTVCKNTCIAAEQEAAAAFRIRHHKDAMLDLRFVGQMMDKMSRTQDTTVETFNRMADQKLTPGDVINLLERIYPAPKLSQEKQQMVEVVATGEVYQMGFDDSDLTRMSDKTSKAKEWLLNQLKRTEAHHEAATILYQRTNDERPGIAGSAYSLYQAVTELEDWKVGRGAKQSAESVLFGERAKTKADAFKILAKV